jgi:CRP/FNR family transcriptional regulator, cyclic AMP receptor protein
MSKPVNKKGATASLLRSHALFGELPDHQIENLSAFASVRKQRKGATIFAKGDSGQALFAIRAGTVKISAPALDGRETIFNILHDGDIFGEIALLDGQPRTADAVAITDCELIAIERRDFLKFVRDEPKAALKLIELLCARLRRASEHFEETVFLGLPSRLARILLRLANNPENPRKIENISITQREISQMLGATRESINKQLRRWEHRNWIRLERGHIILIAHAQIEAIASGGISDD